MIPTIRIHSDAAAAVGMVRRLGLAQPEMRHGMSGRVGESKQGARSNTGSCCISLPVPLAGAHFCLALLSLYAAGFQPVQAGFGGVSPGGSADRRCSLGVRRPRACGGPQLSPAVG